MNRLLSNALKLLIDRVEMAAHVVAVKDIRRARLVHVQFFPENGKGLVFRERFCDVPSLPSDKGSVAENTSSEDSSISARSGTGSRRWLNLRD